MSSALRTEFEAYSAILNNLRSLAQELKSKDPSEFQVIESIRMNLLETLSSLMGGQDEAQAGWA